MKIKKIIIVFLQLLLIIAILLFGSLIFNNEIKKYEEDKNLFSQDIDKLENKISDIKRSILNIFLDDLKNDYAKSIDNACKNSKDEFEVCIIDKIINDFKQQDNYSILKKGKIDINIFSLFYQLKVMNLILKNKEKFFDESCSEHKSVSLQDIHIVKRDIFDTKAGKIHEFSSTDCHDMNTQWKLDGISKPEEYEKKMGHLPGDFLLYEINHFKTKKYYFDGKFLNIAFKLSDDSTRKKKYKQYIKFVSYFEPDFPDEQINFNYIDINFKINITDYKIKEINVIDNYKVKRFGVNGKVINTLDMFFFYGENLFNVNETDKIDYHNISCTDYCSNFEINEN